MEWFTPVPQCRHFETSGPTRWSARYKLRSAGCQPFEAQGKPAFLCGKGRKLGRAQDYSKAGFELWRPLKSLCENSKHRILAAEEAAEKVKNTVIPESEVTRNPSFCGHLNQEGSLVRLGGLGMAAFLLFSAACEAALVCGTCGTTEVMR